MRSGSGRNPATPPRVGEGGNPWATPGQATESPFPGEAAPWQAFEQQLETPPHVHDSLRQRAAVIAGGLQLQERWAAPAAQPPTPPDVWHAPPLPEEAVARDAADLDAFHHIMAEAVARDSTDLGLLAAAVRQLADHRPDADPSEEGWAAIDHVPFAALASSRFRHLDDVLDVHTEAWALANVDVLELWRSAENARDEERALKWLVALHDILLRLPPRGGRRGRAMVTHRFQAWAAGDKTALIKWWEADRGETRRGRDGSGPTARPDTDKTVDRALFLISDGEMSRGVGLLTSSGLADAGDPRVQEQLRAKHPRRKEEMPSRLADVGQFPGVALDLGPTLRNLRSHAGTGVSGYRNEYLRAIATDFVDMRARTVLPLLNAFESAYANADLPAWFYTVFTAVKAALPIKSPATVPDAAPDIRPVGVGECLRRAIHSALVAQHKDLLRQHLWPQQVAIGVPSGMSVLVFGVRLTLEIRPDFVVVRLDLKNAHNEVKRASMVRRTAAAEHLGGLVPLLWATCCPKSDIHLPIDGALEKADFASEEGAQQGDGLASAGFCATIHPEVCQLDAELGPHGGAARFDMDDGSSFGPS